uniref:Uncharacterized protein n=1 Tax=Rhizophagus irregularis (strain DAOM 181602 / DAOM 197198 / MUCL 43194) TaxID=747089 RepID=U9TTL0_RHIID
MVQNLCVTLIKPGSIVSELHYRPYSFYWWIFSDENKTLFPIKLGQQTKVHINEVDFILTIQTGSGNSKLMPMYCCQSGLHVVTESSSIKAISTAYKNHFNTSTRHSGYQAMGWNNKNILETLKKDVDYISVTVNIGNCKIFIYSMELSSHKKWCYVSSSFQSSLLHRYKKNNQFLYHKLKKRDALLKFTEISP